MYMLNFWGHKYTQVLNNEFFDIVITNLSVSTNICNYA